MKTIEIKHRYTGVVLYSTEVEDNDPNPIKSALERANLVERANLDGANLDGVMPSEVHLARLLLELEIVS